MILSLELIYFVWAFLFLVETEGACQDESINYLLDNHDMIYQKFPQSLRQSNPRQPANLDGGICCLETKEVYVPVGSSAKFSSPNYPNHYPSDMDCGWSFKTDLGYVFDMQCEFIHLKRNDYLDMQENNSYYSYVENIQNQSMIHYFWSGEVRVGFHSDQETGVEGFQCQIWPVDGCSGISGVSETTTEFVSEDTTFVSEDTTFPTSEESTVTVPYTPTLKYGPIVVQYENGGSQYMKYPNNGNLSTVAPDYFERCITFNIDGLLTNIGDTFIYCKVDVSNCYYCDITTQGEWNSLVNLERFDMSDVLKYVTSSEDRAIFAANKTIYEVFLDGTYYGYKPELDYTPFTNLCLTNAKERNLLVTESGSNLKYYELYTTSVVGNDTLQWPYSHSYSAGDYIDTEVGCLQFGVYSYIAGFYRNREKVTPYLTNTNTRTELPLNLEDPKMAVIDGKPAIIGGYDYDAESYTTSIFTFDTNENTFERSSLKLEKQEKVRAVYQFIKLE